LAYGFKATLPDYMIPDDLITVPAIPLTPNGKVDKKALAGQQPNWPKVSTIYCPKN